MKKQFVVELSFHQDGFLPLQSVCHGLKCTVDNLRLGECNALSTVTNFMNAIESIHYLNSHTFDRLSNIKSSTKRRPQTGIIFD